MKTRRARSLGAAVFLLLSLVMAGCGSDDGEDAPVTSDRAAARSGAEAEQARHLYVDPCALLDSYDRFTLNESAGAATVRLFPSGVEFNSCSVYRKGDAGGSLVLNYGYSVEKNPDLAGYAQESQRIGDAKVTPLDGVGDEAFYIADGRLREAWARSGDYTIFVWSAEPSLYQNIATQTLEAMLAKATPGMLEHPAQVPPECPALGDRRVLDVLGGKPVRALGQSNPRGVVCDYATETKSVTLSVSASNRAEIESALNVSEAFEKNLGSGGRDLTLAPRSLTKLKASEFGPYAFTYTLDPPTIVAVTQGSVFRLAGDYGYPRFDQAAFADLNRFWVKQELKRLRK